MKVMLALAGSQILYHIIDLKHAVAAVRSDKFTLAPVLSSGKLDFEAMLHDGKPHFFMSLARSKDNDYFRNNAYGADKAIFVLDGQKMNANYKVKPVNYWHQNTVNKDDESEDRLFATKATIPCLRYVKEIHFTTANDGRYNSAALAIIAKQNKIALFQYANAKELILMDKRKVIPLNVSSAKGKKLSERDGRQYGATTTSRAEAWWDAIAFPDDETLNPQEKFVMGSKDARKQKFRREVVEQLKNGERHGASDGMVTSFKNDLGQRYDDRDAQYSERVAKFMRKRKFDATQLLQYLIEKFQAHANVEKRRLDDEVRAKYPHKPTFYIYKNEDGTYRLEVENYPELNKTADDYRDLEDEAYAFHRKSRNIYSKFGPRIEKMY